MAKAGQKGILWPTGIHGIVDVVVVVQRVQEVLAVVRRVLLANLGGEFAGINAGAAGTIAAVAADHDGGDVERGALTKIKTPETHQKNTR